jgi:hypothetical protein
MLSTNMNATHNTTVLEQFMIFIRVNHIHFAVDHLSPKFVSNYAKNCRLKFGTGFLSVTDIVIK